MPAVKERLETEHYLSQLTTWILGGSKVFEQIFPGILKFCEASKTGEDMPCNGHMIPASLAESDCTPNIVRLFDSASEVFLKSLAKLRALLETYPPVFIGELPSWDMSYAGAGDKNDISDNPAVQAGVQFAAPAPAQPAAIGAVAAPQGDN